MFSAVNQQAFGGEEGLPVKGGGCKEDLNDFEREYYDSLMERYRRKATLSFQAVVWVLNRFVLPVQTYPLYCVSKLSSSTDTGEKIK